MHPNSMEMMRWAITKYLKGVKGKVLDVGSMDVNGTYRQLFEGVATQYIGLDMEKGKAVEVVDDILLGAPKVPDGYYDMVISGQMLEHCRRPWIAAEMMGKKLAPGGTIILIAPWAIHVHEYPIDCWRILPDGMKELIALAGCEHLHTGIVMNDTLGVGIKPE